MRAFQRLNTKPPKPKESTIQQQVCAYLKVQYPNVIFRSDLGGIRLTIGQSIAVKKIQHSRAFPDLFIAEPRNGSNGLFLELKRDGTKITLKDGVTLVADEHIREQKEMLTELRKRGFIAEFAIGFEDAKRKIDEYLK